MELRQRRWTKSQFAAGDAVLRELSVLLQMVENYVRVLRTNSKSDTPGFRLQRRAVPR